MTIINIVYILYTQYIPLAPEPAGRGRGGTVPRPGPQAGRQGAERRDVLNIIISNNSGKPIYEQITQQLKSMIMKGELLPGDPLPSMRLLAKELRISVITTKRAYEDLEREGFLETVPGKGSFVAQQDPGLLREAHLRQAEQYLESAVEAARTGGISLAELTEMLALLYQEPEG